MTDKIAIMYNVSRNELSWRELPNDPKHFGANCPIKSIENITLTEVIDFMKKEKDNTLTVFPLHRLNSFTIPSNEIEKLPEKLAEREMIFERYTKEYLRMSTQIPRIRYG